MPVAEAGEWVEWSARFAVGCPVEFALFEGVVERSVVAK